MTEDNHETKYLFHLIYRQSSILKAPYLKYLVLPLNNISVTLLQNCPFQNMWSQYEMELLTNTFLADLINLLFFVI